MKTTLSALVLGSVLAAGCASDPGKPKTFSTNWNDDGGKSIAAVQARLKDVRNTTSTNLVVAVASGGQKVIATPLEGGQPWTFAHALDSRPVVFGNVVILSGGGEVIALDASSGKKLWTRPTGGLTLLGAGDDGTLSALAFARAGGSMLLVVARDGSVKRQLETDQSIGTPAVYGGVVFVPWANQYVSALDGTSGEELGRVVLRDKVSRAVVLGPSLYFGEIAYVRFDDKIGLASRGQANRVAIPSRELPGTPRLLVPGGEKVPVVANARDRDRLYARPQEASQPLAVDSTRFYASYYRLVFGFESNKGHLAWVRTHPSDFIGGSSLNGGVALCDEQGKVTVFDAATGQVAAEKSLGEPIQSCVVHADSYRVPKPGQPGPTLGQQITEAVTIREATLATAQRLLLRELGTLPEESATKTLIDIASDPRSVPILVTDARAALATRRNGGQFMLEALGKHYDYLHDVLMSPPVGPIADALAAMGEKRAAPLLATHLLDPADTDDDVKRAGAALATIATDKELPVLKQFFSMYRGTAQSDEVALAVGSAAEAMLRIDPKSRPTVESAAADPATVQVAKERLDALLQATAKQ